MLSETMVLHLPETNKPVTGSGENLPLGDIVFGRLPKPMTDGHFYLPLYLPPPSPQALSGKQIGMDLTICDWHTTRESSVGQIKNGRLVRAYPFLSFSQTRNQGICRHRLQPFCSNFSILSRLEHAAMARRKILKIDRIYLSNFLGNSTFHIRK